jgi:hypothetical protein
LIVDDLGLKRLGRLNRLRRLRFNGGGIYNSGDSLEDLHKSVPVTGALFL